MGMITLSSCVPFNPDHKPSNIVLSDVPSDTEMPKGGLTMYYGFREALDEMSQVMMEADKKKQQVAKIRVKVDIGESIAILSPENLEKTRFIKFDRITKSLEDDVKRIWKLILKEHNIKEEKLPDNYWKLKNYLMIHPELVGDLRNYEMFSHIDVFVFPYHNPNIASFSDRATLFSAEHVKEITCEGFPEIHIELPPLGDAAKHTKKRKFG